MQFFKHLFRSYTEVVENSIGNQLENRSVFELLSVNVSMLSIGIYFSNSQTTSVLAKPFTPRKYKNYVLGAFLFNF